MSRHIEVEGHIREMKMLAQNAGELLITAKNEGSIKDWNDALKTALVVHERAGKELVRNRLLIYLMEAANVLSGSYDDQEEVELGAWADGADENTIHERAQSFIRLHQGMI